MLELNLNDPKQFTLDNVRSLIASKDDSQDRQLRVTKLGIAYLSDVVGADDIDDILFRFETWDAGNDYAGINASKNDKHVFSIYNALQKNFPNPSSSYLDFY